MRQRSRPNPRQKRDSGIPRELRRCHKTVHVILAQIPDRISGQGVIPHQRIRVHRRGRRSDVSAVVIIDMDSGKRERGMRHDKNQRQPSGKRRLPDEAADAPEGMVTSLQHHRQGHDGKAGDNGRPYRRQHMQGPVKPDSRQCQRKHHRVLNNPSHTPGTDQPKPLPDRPARIRTAEEQRKNQYNQKQQDQFQSDTSNL